MMRTALRWLALAAVVLGTLYACRQWTRSPVDKAGALLWEMTEIHTAFRDSLHHRGVTAEQRVAAVQESARQLARRRDRLAALLPDLDRSSEPARNLAQFVDAWPDEKAFLADLSDTASGGGRCGPAITALAGQFPDARSTWKTPFKLFRP